MSRFIIPTVVIAFLALLLWQVAATAPMLPRMVSAVLVAAMCLLLGLRLGAKSSSAYTTELQRLNKVLVDQNRELEEANRLLLKEVSSQVNPQSSDG